MCFDVILLLSGAVVAYSGRRSVNFRIGRETGDGECGVKCNELAISKIPSVLTGSGDGSVVGLESKYRSLSTSFVEVDGGAQYRLILTR